MKQNVEITAPGEQIDQAAGGCCGGSCCGGGEAGVTDDRLVTEVAVEGMTCSHCVDSIITEVGQVEGVKNVTVSLVPGGQSTVFVQSDAPVDQAAIDAAVDEAGYRTVLK